MRFAMLAVILGVIWTGCDGGGLAREVATVTTTTTTTEALVAPTPAHSQTPLAACFERGPGDYIDTVERPEGERSFRIHVPPGYDGRTPVAMLMNFHGQAQTALHQDEYSQLARVSDSGGFILVSPEGGGGPQEWYVPGEYLDRGIDDVATTAAIVEAVRGGFCIDPARVFATGLSNGAQMAAQVTCQLPGVFAGIAPVAGIIFQGCEGPPVAVIAFHGTADYNVFYDTAPEAVREWANYNGCPAEPSIERIGEHVVRESYFGCTGAPVVFYTLEGGGHTWPGGVEGAGGVGPTNHEIDASELIWELFSRVNAP